MRNNWLAIVARVMERIVPDAITTSILLLVLLLIVGLTTGNPLTTMVEAYYRGLWMLLSFTMQMTLILVLSLVLGATPIFRGIVFALSRYPKSVLQTVAAASLLAAFVGYLNWGLGLALGPLIAVHFAKEAERKGLDVDFMFLLATLGGAGSVWQFGFSASAPLLVATPGHFLERSTGMMSLRSTIWSPAAIVHVLVFTAAVILAGYLLMPRRVRPISDFPESNKLAETALVEEAEFVAQRTDPAALPISQRLEHSSLLVAPLEVALLAWLWHHFFVRMNSLDINSVNTILLLLCFLLHHNIFRFTKALKEAVVSSWPIVVLYHLYAGVAGLIQYTSVGDFLSSVVYPISTEYTYPLLTAIAATVVAIFVPTSGGQWVIQGLVTVKAAEAAGVTAQRGLLALSVGDHMGNLISPFWAVIAAGIARVDFRLFFGYRLIFAVIWFIVGVLSFTFLPC